MLIDCKFHNILAWEGVYGKRSVITIENTQFTLMKNDYGLWAEAMSIQNYGTLYVYNSSVTNSFGSAIYANHNSKIIVGECNFSNNTLNESVVYVQNNCYLTINDTTISNNYCEDYVLDIQYSTLIVTQSKIANNKYGIRVDTANVLISNALIKSHSVTGISSWGNSVLTVTNHSIIKNNGDSGIYVQSDTVLTVTNYSIIENNGNSGIVSYDATVLISNHCEIKRNKNKGIQFSVELNKNNNNFNLTIINNVSIIYNLAKQGAGITIGGEGKFL